MIRPADLFAETVIQKDRIKLTWSDRSSDETGFEIWRSTTENGSYSLVMTTGANINTYTNTGLTSNTRYFYKVRSVKGAATSNFSNIANAILASKIVLINQNISLHRQPLLHGTVPVPLQQRAQPLAILSILICKYGFEMVITKEFNGAGFPGVNANGVFPANVMVSNYWTDAGQTSQVKIPES